MGALVLVQSFLGREPAVTFPALVLQTGLVLDSSDAKTRSVRRARLKVPFEPLCRSVHYITLTAVLFKIVGGGIFVPAVTTGVLSTMSGGAGVGVVLRGLGKKEVTIWAKAMDCFSLVVPQLFLSVETCITEPTLGVKEVFVGLALFLAKRTSAQVTAWHLCVSAWTSWLC